MMINSSEIREKDVVNVCSGKRLGCICDFVIDTDCGRITAIIVSDAFFTLAGGKNSLCIPIENVERIGMDVVLVRADETCRQTEKECGHGKEMHGKKNRGWFFCR